MPGFELIGKEERRAINDLFDDGGVLFAHGFDALRNGRYRVREFEKKFADYLGVNYAQAVSSGTGCVDVLFDEEMYIDHLTTIDEDEDTLDMELPPKKSEYCSSENFDFSIKI